jgi:hypothetical protein
LRSASAKTAYEKRFITVESGLLKSIGPRRTTTAWI